MISRSLLVWLSFIDGKGSIPCTTCNWIKFKVLLECLSLTRGEIESLLFIVDRQKVEGWHQEDREGEWNRGQTPLTSLVATSEGKTENRGIEHMI